MSDPERTPVIVGVGQVNDRASDLNQALDSVGLMHAALNASPAGTGVIARCVACYGHGDSV